MKKIDKEWLLLIKNGGFSALLIWIFSYVPGWKVSGVGKFLLCVAFAVVLTLLMWQVDMEINEK